MLCFIVDFYLIIDMEQNSEDSCGKSETAETPQERSDEEARCSPAESAAVLRNINYSQYTSRDENTQLWLLRHYKKNEYTPYVTLHRFSLNPFNEMNIL